MRRTSIIGLTMVAAVAFGCVTAAAASAAGPDWFVSGSQYSLTSPLSIETRIEAGSTFKLEGTLGTQSVTLQATGISTEGAYIQGNGSEPGTDGAEAIVLTGVRVVSPTNCVGDEVASRKESGATKSASGTIKTGPVTTALSYFDSSKIADTFTPDAGKPLVEIYLKKAVDCPITTGYYAVTGHVAGEELDPEVESEYKDLEFEASQAALSSLEFDGDPAHLGGLAEQRIDEAGLHPVWTAK